MTEEEAEKILEKMTQVGPDRLRQIDKQFDKFIATICKSLNTYSDMHRAEMIMLGKTLIIACTDKVVKKLQGEPIGALTLLGDPEDVAALYRALGTALKEQGILENEEC